MLMGTSCRFSARLRAVTMTSCSVSEEASAACAGKAWKPAAPDRAAAMAMASLEGENVAGDSRRDEMAAECAGDLRLIFIPLYFDYYMRPRACRRWRSCLAGAFSVNRVNRTFNNKLVGFVAWEGSVVKGQWSAGNLCRQSPSPRRRGSISRSKCRKKLTPDG